MKGVADAIGPLSETAARRIHYAEAMRTTAPAPVDRTALAARLEELKG